MFGTKEVKSSIHAQAKIGAIGVEAKVIFATFSSGSVGQPSFPLSS